MLAVIALILLSNAFFFVFGMSVKMNRLHDQLVRLQIEAVVAEKAVHDVTVATLEMVAMELNEATRTGSPLAPPTQAEPRRTRQRFFRFPD